MDGIPTSQKETGVDKWPWVLRELCSTTIALPITRGLFRYMQKTLLHVEGKRVTLIKGVYQDLANFCWLKEDLGRHPTRLYELVRL